MTDFRLFAEIAKVRDRADGTVDVWGFASTGARDSQGEIITPEAMKAALPDYMKFGAVREMHQPSAVGTALDAEVRDSGETWFGAHIVDSEAVKKVKHKVFKGFSIGGAVTRRDDRDSTVVTALDLIEVSLVDRPANPEAVITVMKRLQPEEGTIVTITNDQIVEKAKELAKAAGKGDAEVGDYLDAAKAELEKAAVVAVVDGAAAVPALDDAALKAARAKLRQKWTTTDGHAFDTADAATKHEAAQALIDPATKAALAAGNAALALKTTITESTSATSGLTSYDLEGSHQRAAAAETVDEPAHTMVEANHQGIITIPAQTAQDKAKAKERADAEEEAKRKKAEEDEAEKAKKAADETAKREFGDKERQRLAGEGKALPDGSFPIENKKDLENAIHAYGRAKNKAKAKAHIIARAKALGATGMLPEGWGGDDKEKKKAATAAELNKGMQECARMACIIDDLEWLHRRVEMEQLDEDDTASDQPAQIKENIARLCATLRAMIEEETSELLNGDEEDDFGELMELAAENLMPSQAISLTKVTTTSRILAKADNAIVTRFGALNAALAKVGRRHNKGDMEKIQKMHDHCVEMGAKCASDDGMGKGAGINDGSPVASALETNKQLVAMVTKLAAKVEEIAAQPAVIPPTRLSVIGKNEDVMRELERMSTQTPAENAHELIKAAFTRPIPLNGPGSPPA